MIIPTEPIGSIPRPLSLIAAVAAAGDGSDPRLEPLYDDVVRDTVARFEGTGSPVMTDGEQKKDHNFWPQCAHGLANLSPGGFQIPFSAAHTSTTRETAFAKIRARVRDTALAAEMLSKN